MTTPATPADPGRSIMREAIDIRSMSNSQRTLMLAYVASEHPVTYARALQWYHDVLKLQVETERALAAAQRARDARSAEDAHDSRGASYDAASNLRH